LESKWRQFPSDNGGLIPIADRHLDYADKIREDLKHAGLRIELDDSNDRMGNKIRKAQEQKIPYMLIIGDREVKSTSLSLRLRTGEDLGSIGIESFIRRVRDAITAKEGI
jgi:threonyl-tRNA synthetase